MNNLMVVFPFKIAVRGLIVRWIIMEDQHLIAIEEAGLIRIRPEVSQNCYILLTAGTWSH